MLYTKIEADMKGLGHECEFAAQASGAHEVTGGNQEDSGKKKRQKAKKWSPQRSQRECGPAWAAAQVMHLQLKDGKPLQSFRKEHDCSYLP